MKIDWLSEQTAAFADAVAGLAPESRVPTCPEWSVRVLVGHIGQADRWAAEIVRTGMPAGFPDPRDADPGPPPNWTRWLLDGATELTKAVEVCSTAVWTFIGPQPASFWLRRMAHDTAVHYVDVAITAGIGYRIDADVAVDAIDEGLELVASPAAESVKPGLVELRGAGQTLQLQSVEAAWLITRTPSGVRWERATAEADVTVAGSAQDLLLLLYGRLTLDDVPITGDRQLMSHWLEHTAV